MSDSDEIRHRSDLKRSDLQVGSLDLGLPEEVNETDGVFANGLINHETNDAAEPLTNGHISSNDEDSALLDKIDCFKTVRIRSFH